MGIAPPPQVDTALGTMLQQLADSTDVIAAHKTTKYKDYQLEELFNLCNIPINVPPFWVHFHKHRGKINDARSYIEHHFEQYSLEDDALDSVVFSHYFIQNMMGHNLYGRDRMTEFVNRFHSFSIFSVGPIGFNFNTGESQHQEFV